MVYWLILKEHYLSHYFEETGIRINNEDIIGMDEIDCVPDKTAVRRYLNKPDFFRTIPVAKDAQDVVKDLQAHYDIFCSFCSNGISHVVFFERKNGWLNTFRLFPGRI